MRKSVPGTFTDAEIGAWHLYSLIYDRIRHVFEEEGEGFHLVDGGLDNRVKHPFDQGSDKDREVDHFVQVCSVATNLGAPSRCNNANRGTHV
jgi:hypothetical protein